MKLAHTQSQVIMKHQVAVVTGRLVEAGNMPHLLTSINAKKTVPHTSTHQDTHSYQLTHSQP